MANTIKNLIHSVKIDNKSDISSKKYNEVTIALPLIKIFITKIPKIKNNTNKNLVLKNTLTAIKKKIKSLNINILTILFLLLDHSQKRKLL